VTIWLQKALDIQNLLVTLQRVFHGIRLLRLITEDVLSGDNESSTPHLLECLIFLVSETKREPVKVPFSLMRFNKSFRASGI